MQTIPLHQLVLNSWKDKNKHDSGKWPISISGGHSCPRAMYNNIQRSLKGEWDSKSVEERLNMNNGHWQEEESVSILKDVNVEVTHRQHEVHVGRSQIIGHIDGLINYPYLRLWEHKGMDGDHFYLLTNFGLKLFPGYYVQSQLYMMGLRNQGMNIIDCCFYAKEKEHNQPYSTIIPYDELFARKIVDNIDAILLDNWIPPIEENDSCPYCRDAYDECFHQDIIDFSTLRVNNDYDGLTKALFNARTMKQMGEEQEEKIKLELSKIGGDANSIVIGGIYGRHVKTETPSVSKEKVVEVFGNEGLMKVLVFNKKDYWIWKMR